MRKDPLRFLGTYQQLQAIVSMTGFPGEWELMPAGYRRFRCRSGAILNWWPNPKTVNFQGPTPEKEEFRHAVAGVLSKCDGNKDFDNHGPRRLPGPR